MFYSGDTQLELGLSEGTESPGSPPPYDYQMAEVIAMEDLDFFMALLEGKEPPALLNSIAKDFMDEEQKSQRENRRNRLHEAQLRRTEELRVMQADMDFYLTLL